MSDRLGVPDNGAVVVKKVKRKVTLTCAEHKARVGVHMPGCSCPVAPGCGQISIDGVPLVEARRVPATLDGHTLYHDKDRFSSAGADLGYAGTYRAADLVEIVAQVEGGHE